MSIITYQDYERATDKTAWLQDALVSYRNSDEFKKALDEQEYMAGRNTAIQQTVRVGGQKSGTGGMSHANRAETMPVLRTR